MDGRGRRIKKEENAMPTTSQALAENKACNCSQITLFTMQCLKKDRGHDTEQYVLDLK